MAKKQSAPADLFGTLPLSRFIENPDNPQTVTDEAFDRLVGKLRRVPDGLTANSIAYVTDHTDGKFVVLSGNKRLRALKLIYGEDYAAPASWFEDITSMTPAQRKEFILDANINEGEWDVARLLEQYDTDALGDIFDADDLSDLLADITKGSEASSVETADTEESKQFEEKFVPKKTTDDCYTPENIFAAVLDWAANRYGFDKSKIIRPFFPGADYTTTAYPKGYTVVDNPPFSIFSEIVKFYCERNIPFFLFGPHLTLASTEYSARRVTYVVCGVTITYANGAVVSSSFITNLSPDILMTVEPELHDILSEIDDKNRKAGKADLKKHAYPDCVISVAHASKLAAHHTPLVIRREDAAFIRSLDAQKESGDAIFGGGFLLSERAAAERAVAERAAAERAAAHKWELSPREIALQQSLGRKDQP